MSSSPGRLSLLAALGVAVSCSSPEESAPITSPISLDCASPRSCLLPGSPDGRLDPATGRTAGQAWAGRLTSLDGIREAPDRQMKVKVDDYLLINDKIAAFIQGKRPSEGFGRFGGELLSVDAVGPDGRPRGLSLQGESLVALGTEAIDPESVTVINDGTDGRAAIVRVQGKLSSVAWLAVFKGIQPGDFGFPASLDYILDPGSERLRVRMTLHNTSDEEMDLGRSLVHAFFPFSRTQMITREHGYGGIGGKVDWIGFDGGEWGIAWRTPDTPMAMQFQVSAYVFFTGGALTLQPGEIRTRDHIEIIAGAGFDGISDAVRRADGDSSWREVTGKILDGTGAPVAGAFVHELGDDGAYLSRAITDASGTFRIHAPPTPVRLLPSAPGLPPHAGSALPPGVASLDLSFAAHAALRVRVRDAASSEPLPARVRVDPQQTSRPPAAWGELPEREGTLHQALAIEGEAELRLPPGAHRVLVSRGYEWDTHVEDISVAAGETRELDVLLPRSVQTPGALCGDFHLHSYFSFDSDDSLERKVRAAVVDGLEIPVSSEHEWVADFQPIIERLKLTRWAFGVPSSELTTYTWGHFGILPLRPRPDALNAGAIDWFDRSPEQTFEAAHQSPDRSLVIVNHPRVGGPLAYFNWAGFDPGTATGRPGQWSDQFDAIEVFNDSDFDDNRKGPVADWFSLLDQGRPMWALGSSDNHHVRDTSIGYPRTYLLFGHDDPTKLTPELVRDAVARGAMTISGGLYLEVKGPGGEGPGETISTGDGKAQLSVTIQAPGWIDADSLEVIVNGVTVLDETLDPPTAGGPHRWERVVPVQADPSRPRSWVVVHARGKGDLSAWHLGKKPFAASNPIFLERP